MRERVRAKGGGGGEKIKTYVLIIYQILRFSLLKKVERIRNAKRLSSHFL